MTKPVPEERPVIDEALRIFEGIVSLQTTSALNWRLKCVESGNFGRLWGNVMSSFYVCGLLTRRALRSILKGGENIKPV